MKESGKKQCLHVRLISLIICAALVFSLESGVCQEKSGKKVVATSFYPIYIFALNLLDGVKGAEVHNMAAPGTGCLHDYQLSSGDMKQLAQADCLLICGAGMESYLSTVYSAFPTLPVYEGSEGIDLLPEDSEALQVGESEELVNSHIWLDPKNAAAMVENLARGLETVLADDAEKIAENCAAYAERLRQLDEEIAHKLEGCAHRDIVTFHEAFPYFAKAYGLNVAAVVNREPGDALSPAQLAGLVRAVKELGNPPLFTEPQYDDMAAATLARETGAPVYSLDPVVTGPDVPPLDYYETIMRENADTLARALQ